MNGKYYFSAAMDVPQDKEALFNEVYDKERIPDLAEVPAILPQPDTITFKLIDQVFTRNGLLLNAPMPTNFLETIKMMVSVGIGWSLLPASMLDKQLHQLDWPAEPVTRQLGLIHLKKRTLSNAASALIGILKQE